MSENINTETDKYRNNAVSNTKILVRSGPLSIKGIVVNNADASVAFLQLHDAAATDDVTLGTTVPTLGVKIAASSSKEIIFDDSNKLPLSLGLVIAATTTEVGSTATTTPLSVLILYK